MLVAQSNADSAFQWFPDTYLNQNDNDTVIFVPPGDGNYTLKVYAYDTLGCYDSAVVDITVFEPFSPGSISTPVELCSFIDSTTLVFDITPSGDLHFTYNWLVSTDSINFTSLNALDTSFLTLNTLDTSLFYSAEVSSINGCGTDTIQVIDLISYPPFTIGYLDGTDTLCRYAIIDTLKNLNTVGGTGNYNFSWYSSFDGFTWSLIPNINTPFYVTSLSKNTYFKSLVTDLCGEDTTNVIFDSILPSPVMIDIIGDSVFCANQHDNIFWIDQSQPNISYDWQVNGGVISQQISDTAFAVDMDDMAGSVLIELHMTHNATGCDVLVEKLVTTSANSSPNRTQVIRKPNSDILVCDDSTVNLIYQWGFTEKSSGTDTEILGGNLRYVLLPHSFDSTTYRYWVRTSFDYGGGESCETMSYLGPSPITNDELIFSTTDLVAYPNPTTDFIQIPNAYFSFDLIWVSDAFGRKIDIPITKESEIVRLNLSTLSMGMYYLSVLENGYKFSIPIIKQ